jgi:flagellar motor switch protein FliN/FliY
MSDKLLKQEEIDALLNAKTDGTETGQTPQNEAAAAQEPDASKGAAGESAGLIEIDVELSGEQKDALGEIGNISMGAAATTLSLLLNQKVSITSPRVTVTTLEKLFEEFIIPHMTIYVRFVGGLSGFNLLIIKMKDAAVMADLMMGGDGTNAGEELSEIGISAASEAMNQMIGSASTSLATMFSREINISPPETKIFRNADEVLPEEMKQEGPVVVASFNMTVGDILNTRIMQVMGIDTAREEATLLLGELLAEGAAETLEEEPDYREQSETTEAAGDRELVEERIESAMEDAPAPFSEAPAASGTQPAVSPVAEGKRPAATTGIKTPGSPVAPPGIDQQRLNLILDIPLKVTVLLGRTKWPIKEILELTPGSVVEMQNPVDAPVEVLVNGVLVALGEVVVVNENFGVRITNILSPEERVKTLGVN